MSNSSIKSWSENDRPREKMMLLGKDALSDAELLSILIRTGTASQNALEVARSVLMLGNNNLADLSRLTIDDLSKINGLGKVKAVTIIAALELGRRRRTAESSNIQKIKASIDAVEIFRPHLADLSHEEFWILLLNRANAVIGKKNVSRGGLSGTLVDPKIIFKESIEARASGIILCHNHPSGNNRPSDADIRLTQKIKEGGRHLEISILDHIIIAGSSFYSFADDGLL
jgi:DNA repair protein RadC